jgi:hypothetical protein
VERGGGVLDVDIDVDRPKTLFYGLQDPPLKEGGPGKNDE